MTFVGSQSFISPPSFMFVSAAVSEIRELNQNKKKEQEKKNYSEIGYFHFNTFPARIIYPFFLPEVPFEHINTFILVRGPVHHKLKVIIKVSLSTL